MNLTELKNGIAKMLDLTEEATADAVYLAVTNKIKKLQEDQEAAVLKLEQLKEENKITDITEDDFRKAALEGLEIDGGNKTFVSSSLRTFRQESYCRENTKFFYYKAERAGDSVTLTKIQL